MPPIKPKDLPRIFLKAKPPTNYLKDSTQELTTFEKDKEDSRFRERKLKASNFIIFKSENLTN